MNTRLSEKERQILAEIERHPWTPLQLSRKLTRRPEYSEEEVLRLCEQLEERGLLEGQQPDALDARILEALESGPRTTAELSARIGEAEEVVERHCRSMKSFEDVSSAKLNELDGKIFDASKEYHSTPELAERIGEDRKAVYRRCKHLTGTYGFLASESKKSERRLFFFPVTGDVLNLANYQDVSRIIDDMRAIATKYPIQRGADLSEDLKQTLRREYRDYLLHLASRVSERDSEKIVTFEGELMRVLSGTKKSEVVALFGARPFHPNIRVWRTQPPGNPTWRNYWTLGTKYWFMPGGPLPGNPMRWRRRYRYSAGSHAGKSPRRRGAGKQHGRSARQSKATGKTSRDKRIESSTRGSRARGSSTGQTGPSDQ